MGWEIKKKLSNPKMLLFYASLIDKGLEMKKKIANKGSALKNILTMGPNHLLSQT